MPIYNPSLSSSSPGGPDTSVQFNNAGMFGGDSGFVYKNSKVGIGTNNPLQTLTVEGDMSVSDHSALGPDSSIDPLITVGIAQNYGDEVDVGVLLNVSGILTPTVDGNSMEGIVSNVSTDPNTSINHNVLISANINAEHDGSGSMANITGLVGIAQNSGIGNVDSLFGLQYIVANDGGGTAGDLIALEVRIVNSNGGTVDSAIGLHIGEMSNDNVVNSLYGIKVEDQNVATDNWAIKTGLGLVELGDTTQIIIPNSTHTGLVIRGDTSQSANLQEWQDSSTNILVSVDKDGNITSAPLTGSGTRMVTASSAGLLGTQAIPSGTNPVSPSGGSINGVNADFTFTVKPILIVSDGATYRENFGWTWSGSTATMSSPPVFDLFGL